MKKYLTPNMEIKSFAAENVVTASDAAVDSWNTDNGYNAKTVDWRNLKAVDERIFF